MKNNISLATITLITVLLGVQSSFAASYSYVGLPKGMIHLSYVEYNDPNTVTVTSGYGECNGHYWEITTPIQHDVNSLSMAEDFHYIYIDDDAFVYPPEPTIIDSITEPVWSNEKLGWYNGNDRCIGVVWSPADTLDLMEYAISSNLMLVSKNSAEYVKQVLTNGNPSGNWQFLECSDYIPVNANNVRVIASNNDAGAAEVQIRTADAYYSRMFGQQYSLTAALCGWFELSRNGSRDLYWSGRNDDNNYFTVQIVGYQIER